MRTQTLNVHRWEKGKVVEIEALPAILRFLGYDPFPSPKTLPDRMAAKRRVMGWTFKEAAMQLGVHRKIWKAWEGGLVPMRKYTDHLESFLKVGPLKPNKPGREFSSLPLFSSEICAAKNSLAVP